MSAARPRAPLALVGMGLVLPGADSGAALWERLAAGAGCFSEMPGDRPPGLPGEPRARGAFLTGFRVDARRFRLAPRVAEQLNPMHGVLLHAAAAALDDAASAGGPLPGLRTGFVLGTESLGLHGDYSLRARQGDVLAAIEEGLRAAGAREGERAEVLARVRESLERTLAPIAEDQVLMAVGSLAAGRVMSCFDLRGPHLAVDAGSASGLAALDTAWDWLEGGECDAVLVGGASAWGLPGEWALWSSARRLTADVPRPFDTEADGTLLGEGAAVLVVQRLEDARAEGRRILGVVRGLAGAQGGRHGRLAPPAVETFLRAFEGARREAGLSRVDYVECHASGRPREDADEVEALRHCCGAEGAAPVRVGSLKAVLGELRGASAIAGVVKVCLALGRGVFPPGPAVESPLPELVGGGLRLATGAEPWLPHPGRSRVGAVTACSDSGAVYHVLLEGPESLQATAPSRARGGGFPRLAIVGLGARLPDAPGAESFWSNALVGHGSIREVPPERFNARRYLDVAGSGTRVYSTLGATLPRPPRDGARQGLSPAALAQVDAAWLPAVDAALEASADAGPLLASTPPERMAVVIASAPQREREYEAAARVALARVVEALRQVLEARGVPAGQRSGWEESVRARLQALYPPITEDTVGGCGGAALAAQVARRVGARGVAFTVESACASSLAALAVAARGLERGAYDVALVGGVGDALSPETLLSFCAFRGLSAEGLFPFDERASGFVLGEGAAFLVLRRAEDAEARGERAYAALVGCSGTSDGQGRSAFSPDPVAQAACCERALAQAGVSPSEVDYIECHGTGTPVGDASEVRAYGLAYGGRERERPLVLGSSKSMVGHLNAGAGAVGLLRVALALHHGWLPPTPGFERVSAELPLAEGPFEVGRALSPWVRRKEGGPRRAGVSGFGLGGTSFHAVLEEWRGAPGAPRGEPLAPELSPLLDERRREPGGGSSFRRRLSLERELFLREHIVGDKPALPGAFGCELMVQAAALALPGLRPVGMEDVRFERLLEVPEGTAVEARVLVSAPRPRGPGRLVVDVAVSADFRLPAFPDRVMPRRHYQGRVVLAREPAPRVRVAPEVLAASRAPGRSYQSIYEDHSYCYLGPLFQAIRTSTLLGRERLVARIDVPAEDRLLAGCPAPRFWLGPTLFDNYLQVAGTVGVYHNHCFPMPQGLRQLELWERGHPGDTVWVHATLVRDGGGELFHRIEAFDAEGWLLCRCEDFTTRTAQPFSDSELVTFYRGLTGGPPEYRPPASEAGTWEMSV